MAWNLYTWGTLDLLVARGSYNPPTSSVAYSEIAILPSSNNLNPASALQQGGRNRKRASLKGYATKTDYGILLADYLAGTSKTFTDIDSNTLTAIIEDLSCGYDAGSGYYIYSLSLVEV